MGRQRTAHGRRQCDDLVFTLARQLGDDTTAANTLGWILGPLQSPFAPVLCGQKRGYARPCNRARLYSHNPGNIPCVWYDATSEMTRSSHEILLF